MIAKKPIVIYGIKNCDTMKKARGWLEKRGVAYVFHDYKEKGIDRSRLKDWVIRAGWEKLLNRSSATFRDLPEQERDGLTEGKAIALMLERPTMIKRPVLDLGDTLLVGFNPKIYDAEVG